MESSEGILLKQTLMNVDECFVYRVPPLATAGGHRAEQWDLANPLQTCGLQVERRNNELYLLFTTENHTKLFALAKLHELDATKSVEPVMDSSRYFVTRIQNNSGKQALIGFGFRDRDMALDLLGNLQQFQKSIQREIEAKNLKVTEIPVLGANEKIHVSIGGASSQKKNKTTKSTIVKDNKGSKTTATGERGLLLLKKPPPAAGGQPVSTDKKDELEAASNDELQGKMSNLNLGEEGNMPEANGSAEQPATAPPDTGTLALDDDDDWDDFQQA